MPAVSVRIKVSDPMSSPRGYLSSISRILKHFARLGDVAGIRSYVRSDAFIAAFKGLDPERRQTAMLLFAEAHVTCEARAKMPLAAPVALNARISENLANWRDLTMLSKLADAYSRTRDHEEAARLLGVTVGAARQAKRRYLDLPATDTRPKSP